MRIFAIPAIVIATFLGGCDEEELIKIQTEYKVVIAPDSMYKCPRVTTWPQIKTLTDLQVAQKFVELAKANQICKASLDSIQAYYQDAKVRIEGSNPKKK